VPRPRPFDAGHAERELERLNDKAAKRRWVGPTGKVYHLLVPPTVYPPREDTGILAGVLHRSGLKPGASLLEIGCGSGAVSLHAASVGLTVTACDVNPYAVAATRANFSHHGLQGRVLEGGPGPMEDGSPSQWGGGGLYDAVVWNLPYLPAPAPDEPHLGPLEEASLIDTDVLGLYGRLLTMLREGRLLHAKGVAYVVVSSLNQAPTACEHAWSLGLAARVVESLDVGENERLDVIMIWRPFDGATIRAVHEVASTNLVLLNEGGVHGETLRATMQTKGRGQRGRAWENLEGAFMGSWFMGEGAASSHGTLDQIKVGEAIVRLADFLGHSNRVGEVCLKWPNDVYVRSSSRSRWKKAGGVLFEGSTRGRVTRVVLGVGLNLHSFEHPLFSSLSELGCSLTPEEVHPMLQALVASLFERLPLSPSAAENTGRLVEAVIEGVDALGPVFYRGESCAVVGLEPEGALRLRGGEVVEDHHLLTWSNIEVGINGI